MRTLIVDHEPRTRAMLRNLCETEESIEEVVVTDSGAGKLTPPFMPAPWPIK